MEVYISVFPSKQGSKWLFFSSGLYLQLDYLTENFQYPTGPNSMEKLALKASALDEHFPKSKTQAARPFIICMELDYF